MVLLELALGSVLDFRCFSALFIYEFQRKQVKRQTHTWPVTVFIPLLAQLLVYLSLSFSLYFPARHKIENDSLECA